MRLKSFGYQVIGVTIVLLLSYWTLDFSLFELNSPWVIQGDMVHVYTFAQNVKDHHSAVIFPNLGWPYISDLSNWGIPSIFDFLYFSLTTLFFSAIASSNLLIFFGFVLVQVINFILFRFLKFSLNSSLIISVILTLIPWHFQRALWHVTLANYFTIPLTLVLIIIIFKQSVKFNKNNLLLIISSLILISFTHPYFWFYTEILIFLTLIFITFQKSINYKNFKLYLILLVIPISVLIQKFIVNQGNLYLVLQNPVERSYEFIERYSGSFIAIFMPNPNSGFEFLAKLRNSFDRVSQLSVGESGPWNSIFGVTMFSVAILFFAFTLINRGFLADKNQDANLFINLFIFLFIITLFFYWTTGFGALFSFFITDWIRSWGRLFIYLLYLATLISVLLIRKLEIVRNLKQPQKLAAILIITVIALIDQTYKKIPNDFENTKNIYYEIQSFSQDIDKKLDKDCPILQLPVLRYPEGGAINSFSDYDHFWLYLTNPERKYSYGAVKGTQQGNWQEKIEKNDAKKIIQQAASVGYCAIVVDLRAYKDLVETGNSWIKVAGKPIAVSKNTRLAAFKVPPQSYTPSTLQSLITLTWQASADAGQIQGSKQIDIYDKTFELFVLNPTKEKIKGSINFGARSGNCTPKQRLTIYDKDMNIVISEEINKVTKQFKLNLTLNPREQTSYKYHLGSKECNIEWYSDALLSVRNERFVLN
ncbi:MAG: hypothetical protein RLZZ37_337 [Actinomycetota bacterium]